MDWELKDVEQPFVEKLRGLGWKYIEAHARLRACKSPSCITEDSRARRAPVWPLPHMDRGEEQ